MAGKRPTQRAFTIPGILGGGHCRSRVTFRTFSALSSGPGTLAYCGIFRLGTVRYATAKVHGWRAVVEQVDSLQIHLWLAYLNEITDPRLLAECRLLLSEVELRKLERFRFKRDGHRYLVTRAMVRTVLSKYAEVAPLHWRFVVNDYGKPSIAAEHLAARGIEFNVSHTDGLVVLGVARGREIGVDVEKMRTGRVDIDIADRYFAPSEVRALHALSQQLQLQRFFEYWTLKESYIKARGMGLSIPLDQFAFELDGSRIRLTVDPSLGDSAERWTYQLVPAAEEYLTAVCAERDNNGQLKISSVRWWV